MSSVGASYESAKKGGLLVVIVRECIEDVSSSLGEREDIDDVSRVDLSWRLYVAQIVLVMWTRLSGQWLRYVTDAMDAVAKSISMRASHVRTSCGNGVAETSRC